MSNKLVEETAEIAVQLEEQLKFYRDIGVSDLGGRPAPWKRNSSPGCTRPSIGSFRRCRSLLTYK